MENQRIKLLDQIQMLETRDLLGPEDAAAISQLKKKYNETVETIYQNTPGLFWDIIEVFPEDIWIQIIQEALPTYQYGAALLTLTAVSSKWLQALTSTPILWAYIEIRGSDEDSLATVGIFTHLSRDAPLAVTIYLPLGHDATTLLSILATVGGRIRRIALATDKRVHGQHSLREISAYNCYAGLRFLINAIKRTPNVSVIEIGPIGISPQHFDGEMERVPGILSPLLRVIHGYCFCRIEDLEHQMHLQELYTCEDLNRLAPSLEKLTQLRSLGLIATAATERKPTGLIKNFANFSNLTSLSFHEMFHPSWLNLLTAVAPNLLNLELHSFQLPQFSSIINILQACIKLRTLYLRTRQVDAVSTLAPPSAILGLMNLRLLKFVALVGSSAKDDAGRPIHLEQLSSVITSITELSKRVEEASFILYCSKDERFVRHVLECISKLPDLKRLVLEGMERHITINQPHITLQRLEELDSPFSNAFGTPNLLAAAWQREFSALSISTYDSVRTLHIYDHDRDPHWIEFPRDSLPNLTTLKLIMGGHQHLRLGSLQLLTSISISSGVAGATALCIALLYNPEHCPCLSDIEFLLSSPEWDILFIMLERRNFLTNHSISRIRRISLPFIPDGLRAPLACLLRGIYGNRPSNWDLSFEGVVNLIFDKQISGCLGCLRNMLQCSEPMVILDGRGYLELSIYSTADNPPPLDLDSAVVEWIHRREMNALSWRSACEDFLQHFWRRAVCDKQLDARVEISEHDVPVEW